MARTSTARSPRKSRHTRPAAAPSKAEQAAALRARLDEWQAGYTDEEIAVLTAMHRGYSPRNAMLIAMQCPTATEVRGFKAWREFGRAVRKGEHGIAILAPAGHGTAGTDTPEAGTNDAADAAGGETAGGGKERMFFRMIYVFDVSQTELIGEQADVATEATAA